MAINQKPEIHHNVICANIFVRKDGKWLMLRRSPHKTFAPDVVHPIGGKVDPGEDPYVAAQREVLEEAGITVTNMKLEAVILEHNPVPEHMDEDWMIFNFSADYESGEITATEEGELVMLSSEEIKNEKLFPSIKEAIEYILNPDSGTVFITLDYIDSKTVNQETKIINICGI